MCGQRCIRKGAAHEACGMPLQPLPNRVPACSSASGRSPPKTKQSPPSSHPNEPPGDRPFPSRRMRPGGCSHGKFRRFGSRAAREGGNSPRDGGLTGCWSSWALSNSSFVRKTGPAALAWVASLLPASPHKQVLSTLSNSAKPYPRDSKLKEPERLYSTKCQTSRNVSYGTCGGAHHEQVKFGAKNRRLDERIGSAGNHAAKSPTEDLGHHHALEVGVRRRLARATRRRKRRPKCG